MSNITKYQPGAVAVSPTPEEWTSLRDRAAVIARSGLAPKGLDTPDKVAVALLAAREIQIPEFLACQHAHVINGKFGLSTELLLALAVERVPGFVHRIIEHIPDDRATIEVSRAGVEAVRVTFTMEQAKRANLAGKDTWKSWGEDMLLWSAFRKGMRRIGAGIGGLMLAMQNVSELEGDGDAPNHEPSEATVQVDPAPVLAAAMKPADEPDPAGKPDPKPEAAVTPAAQFKAIMSRVNGSNFVGRGAGQRLTNTVNAVSQTYKLGLQVQSYTEVTSDEWLLLVNAATDYENKKKAGSAMEAATDGAPAEVSEAVVVVPDAEVAPVAPAPTAPPVSSYSEAGIAAADAEARNPDALLDLCKRTEAVYAKAGTPRQFVTPYNDTIFFIDGLILAECGYGEESQDIYALSPDAILLLRGCVTEASMAMSGKGRR